ncbi:hypothetical protein [Streptomyces sp. NBC_00620]|uniref:hypothetical protein n=1 Tax=Streptomyces sp. NBC_00620 TaxID=2903666 RepID=UPI002256F35B|nr:hypothetical protein [Streptomyces sp. NBC_00620]MCX4972161.1 hypothetical protein [Streptomyces sp. NBC_00620]
MRHPICGFVPTAYAVPAFADTASALAYAAGWGPRERRVVKGRSALITAIGGLKADRGGSWRGPEVLICFKAYPPYPHFRRPGR